MKGGRLRGSGFAGAEGFGSGFGRAMLQSWGKKSVKLFVQEAIQEALKLENALARLRTRQKIAVLHYSPVRETVEGESPEIRPFLSSTRLAEAIDTFGASLVVHGHAHHGSPEGGTLGVPVHHSSRAVRQAVDPARPFAVFTLPVEVEVDFDLLCLSHLRWNFVFQRPQHLLSRWTRERRVFFVEEAGYDAGSARLVVESPLPGLPVIVPHLPDGLFGPPAHAARRELLDRFLAEQQADRLALWYYTPMPIPFTQHIPRLATVYDSVDELSAFKFAPTVLREREQALLERADLVFTGGHSLYEAKRDRHPRVYPFPSSVEAAHFARARLAVPAPADQAPVRRPRLGFFGVLDERLDLDLIAGLAEARPDWQLVLVGPVVKY